MQQNMAKSQEGLCIEAAGKVLGALDKAFKVHQFYPEHHELCRRALAVADMAMTNFLDDNASLSAYVEKNRFLFGGEVVYEIDADEGLTALLYRDGILWVAFDRGIQMEEIKGFLDVLKTYRHQEEETEGDVVTALWEIDFSHIRYEAKDVFWETDPLTDFSLPHLPKSLSLQTTDTEGEERSDAEASADLPQENSFEVLVSNDPPDVWGLTEEEEAALHQMVFEQENFENLEDAIDVMLLILGDGSMDREKKHQDLSAILKFLKETLQEVFHQKAFSTGLKILRNLDKVKATCQAEAPKCVVMIEGFFEEISSPDFLAPLSELWPMLARIDARRLKPFQDVLALLHPSAITTLIPMRLQSASQKIRDVLLQTVVALAQKDVAALETLAAGDDEAIVLEALRVLSLLEGRKTEELLLKLSRHRQKQIRKEAIFHLIHKNPTSIRWLFPLIEDEQEGIRSFMLGILGKRRNPLAEELMRGYLEHRLYNITDPQHLLACFQALGRCGSDHTIPFLEKTLLERKLFSVAGLDQLTLRTGAALALFSLNGSASKAVLEKASKSRTPGIRIALKRAKAVRDGR